MRNYLFLIVLFLMQACVGSTKSSQELPKVAVESLGDSIRVELVNIPPRARVFHINGQEIPAENPALAYWGNDLGEIMHYPNRGLSTDTLVIYTQQDTLHLFIGMWGWGSEGLVYPLRKGRSYRFDFVDNIAHPIESEISYFGSFYAKLYRDIMVDGIPSSQRLQFPRILPLKGVAIPSLDQETLPHAYIAQAEREIEFLRRATQDMLRQDTLMYAEILGQYAKNYEQVLHHIAPYLELGDTPPTAHEEPIWAYQLERDVERLGRRKIYESNQPSIEAYQKVLEAEGIASPSRRRLLSSLLWRMSEEAPLPIFKAQAAAYKRIYPDTALPEHIYQHYLDTTRYEASDVLLMDVAGNKRTLSDLLVECLGDSVVLDVWATWCAPCLRDIRSGIAERQSSAREEAGIRYIFLAYQDSHTAWRSRLKELGLDTEPHSYFVLNSDAKWFEAHHIKELPTKMLFNRSGQLVCKVIGVGVANLN